MGDEIDQIDLKLWLDSELLQKQNLLKTSFLELFEDLANNFPNELLREFFTDSRGKKISKGSNLLGAPYLVLDLIRNFDLDTGANLRLINWFGQGMFICAFFGKNFRLPVEHFLHDGFAFGLTEQPWELPEQVLEHKTTRNVTEQLLSKAKYQLWIKKLELEGSKKVIFTYLKQEIEKILALKSTPQDKS
ncbi:MAG: hypothetical protein ACKO44_02145 [Algoriphagus sp.]